MRPILRSLLLALCIAASLSCAAQEDGTEEPDEKLPQVDAFELLDETANVPGVGRDVPGIDLMDDGKPRSITADDTAFAARDYPDRAWADEDSVTAPGRVHWVRFWLGVDASMKYRPMFLEISTPAEVEAFVNGERILNAGGRAQRLSSAQGDGSSISRITMPVMFAGDGRPESIALRLDLGEGKIGPRPRLDLSLHSADIEGIIQRGNLHTGLFIGVNLIIFLLAIILWSFDRADKNWLLLAAITLITAYIVLAKEADTWSIGFGKTGHDVLAVTGTLLYFWPSFLLIMLLRRLLALPRWKHMPFYLVAIILLSACMVALGLADMLSNGDMEITARTVGVGWAVVIGIGAVFMGVAFVSLLVQVVRLSTKLLRSHGYVRWIGAGTLFSVLAPAALGMLGGALGMPRRSPVELLSDYFSYVGLPISVTVFLAIRSAHHNKAVARQRDDLDREVHERTAELRQERDRSDELLLNILPHEVAEELKRTGAAAAKHFDQASVLFTDFKGFTTMSEQFGAGELLQELNTCFKAFDDIIGARGIEKIKTIGDAYMCAGGLPDPKSSSPVDVVFAALEMQAFMEKRRIEREAKGQLAFVMRVGIHTGPVVAGIVGVKKFQYDIWGDTVNTASRMESSGEVGQVNISGSTYALVKDVAGLAFTSRGKVQAKGKGEMEMYFVGRA